MIIKPTLGMTADNLSFPCFPHLHQILEEWQLWQWHMTYLIIPFLVTDNIDLLKADLLCSSCYIWWINGQNVWNMVVKLMQFTVTFRKHLIEFNIRGYFLSCTHMGLTKLLLTGFGIFYPWGNLELKLTSIIQRGIMLL